MTETHLTPGLEFAGYRIEREVGRGGMGVVYLAEQVRLGRLVALKVIAPDLAATADYRARFEREAQIAAALEHSNVVPVFDAGEQDGHLFLAMRFVQGEDFGRVISRGAPVHIDLVVQVIARAGSALDAAHARGLLHRDVKPTNILLESGTGVPSVYLTDFGIAKSIHQTHGEGLTAAGELLGSVDYISPEQLIEGVSIDGRADLYALGCVLFHALSGRPPFQGTVAQKMWGHVNVPPPSLGAVDRLASVFDPVVQRALAKSPADRFQSGSEFGRAVREAAVKLHDPGGLAKAVEAVETEAIDMPTTRLPAEAFSRSGWMPWAIAMGFLAAVCLVVGAFIAGSPSGDRSAVAERVGADARVTERAGRAQDRRRSGASAPKVSKRKSPSPTVASPSVSPASVGKAPLEGAQAWPAGVSAYTTILGSFRSRAEAERRASDLGGGVGILDTDDHRGLTPGYWAVFAGQHGTSTDADLDTAEWHRRAVADAYTRYVPSR